jgi:IS5 family transposase
MKNQTTFSDVEYQNRKHTTPREAFLDAMNKIIPWDRWIAMIAPYYPSGKRGRPTRGIETMLRMYLLQIWFNLSDVGVEDAIYDSYCMRKFMGLDFMTESVPDATTLLKFRHLLEENGIGKIIFDDIKKALDDAGLIMHGGTIVDATLIAAPSSTKNAKGERDPEMHHTKKYGVLGWYDDGQTAFLMEFDSVQDLSDYYGTDNESWMGIDEIEVGERVTDGSGAMYMRIW